MEFSYSVDWIEEPQLAWQDRMLRYVDSRFIPSTFEVESVYFRIACRWTEPLIDSI